MSLHLLSHPWEVQTVADGTVVKLSHRDLDVQTLSILTDDLLEIALESDSPTLYLDFAKVKVLNSVVLGKFFALERRLHQAGGRLVLCNLSAVLDEVFKAANWPGYSTPE